MAQNKNTLLRVLVPILAIAAGFGIVWAIATNTGRKGQGSSAPTPSGPGTPAGTTVVETPPTAPTDAVAAPSPTPTQAVAQPGTLPPAGATGLRAKVWPSTDFGSIGSLDPKVGVAMRVEFTPAGAGVRSIQLSDHHEDLKNTVHVEIQRSVEPSEPGASSLVPFAALGVYVNDQFVNLVGSAAGPVWRPSPTGVPGAFEAVIVNDQDEEIVRVERGYALRANGSGIELTQRAVNLSAGAVKIRWFQLGPIDLPADVGGYGGDKRRVRFGYLHDAKSDPTRRAVMANEFLEDHPQFLGQPDGTGVYPPTRGLWPNTVSQSKSYELVWTGLTNRYFGVALHTPGDPAAKALPLTTVASVDRVVLTRGAAADPTKPETMPVAALRVSSGEIPIAPGASADLSLGVYAGPLSRPALKNDPVTRPLGLGKLVEFNFGGPCGIVTFDWITGSLFWLLRVLHDYLTRDWTLAIMLLVVVVRTILHPVTKSTQIRMQRFGKQMAAMGPKQKQIQERYKDDKKKMQEEMAKLWREEGVSPMGALGCLPMFLMTPVWIALYAMLYFAVELRHQPAFYGVFQKLSNHAWGFMGDLSKPDHLYDFGRVIANLWLIGPVSAVNILPLILGAVFWVHQKYLTPPSTTVLTPEQEMQQKMVKVMSVVMFPVFMYNAPSGLAVYFITNSVLAIFENKYIRAHIDEYDLLNIEKHRQRKKTGFMARLQQAAEQRAKMVEQMKQQQARRK